MLIEHIFTRRRTVDIEAPTPGIVDCELPASADTALKGPGLVTAREIHEQCPIVEPAAILGVDHRPSPRRYKRSERRVGLAVDHQVVRLSVKCTDIGCGSE